MSPRTPPVNEFNGGRKGHIFSGKPAVSWWNCVFSLSLSLLTVLACARFQADACLQYQRMSRCGPAWVKVCRSSRLTHTHTHTRGTKVLLISAWAAERPLKVSLNWWMFCRAQASVFNLSHWRTGTASTSNDFLSSAVRDRLAQMWTFPPLTLFHFSDTFSGYLCIVSAVVKRNVNSHVLSEIQKWDGTVVYYGLLY